MNLDINLSYLFLSLFYTTGSVLKKKKIVRSLIAPLSKNIIKNIILCPFLLFDSCKDTSSFNLLF